MVTKENGYVNIGFFLTFLYHNSVKKFLTTSTYFKQQFGQKVYKIALSCSTTCPNRDGSKGVGGCIFCSQTGSGDFTYHTQNLEKQIQCAKALVNKKFKGESKKYIAYFQNFTNTYGEISRLEKIYNKVLEDKDIVGLSIGTRPDCITPPVLELLKNLSGKTKLIIELGLQTSREESVRYINRCYENKEYLDAVKALHTIDKNIHVITHIILGLPGETDADMLQSVKFAVDGGTDGIKLALLHVLKDTRLVSDYNKGFVPYYDEEQYFKLLVNVLNTIPENIIIHRLTGDGPKALLISPLWTGNKKQVLNALNRYLNYNDIYLL